MCSRSAQAENGVSDNSRSRLVRKSSRSGPSVTMNRASRMSFGSAGELTFQSAYTVLRWTIDPSTLTVRATVERHV